MPAAKMTSKRKQTTDEVSPNKKSKNADPEPLEIGESSSAAAEQSHIDQMPLRIIDLNVDCLCQIFSYLNANEIQTIATVDEALEDAAKTHFKHVYGQKLLVIDRYATTIDNQPIQSHRLIEFFQIFGSCITKISIQSYMVDVLWNLIGSTLKHVTDVRFSKYRLTAHMSQLNRYFPKMTRLDLIDVDALVGECIETHFPLLDVLKISVNRAPKPGQHPLTAGNILRALANNPQIKSLELDVPFGSDLLLEINKLCPNVHNLWLTCDTKVPIDVANPEPLAYESLFQNVKWLGLRLLNWSISTTLDNEYVERPSTRSMLNYIHYTLRRSLIDSDILGANDLHDGTLMRLAELFPNVEDIALSGDLHVFSGSGLTAFIEQMDKLEEIRFEMMELGVCNELQQNIDASRWEMEEGNQLGGVIHEDVAVKRLYS